MKCKSTIVVSLLATLLPIGMMFAQSIDPKNAEVADSSFFCVGEELTYEVSWAFIKLGTIRTKVLQSDSKGDRIRYSAACYIDSYPELVVANLHVLFETSMNKECYSDDFVSRERDGDVWDIVHYRFERNSGKIIIEESAAKNKAGEDAQIKKLDTVSIAAQCLDGLSLLYFARANASSRKNISASTVIQGKQGVTEFNFYGKQTSTLIKVLDYPINVVEFEGNAKYSGVFGLSGPFKGWFSNDAAHVPIRAKLKVILGSVTIELKKWHRTGWSPPRYTSN
jgi:hypothetical protein